MNTAAAFIVLALYVWHVGRSYRDIGQSYLRRFHIVPRNRWFNIYLHRYSGSDDDRALHDHPWRSVSFLLWGDLWEVARRYTYVLGEIPISWTEQHEKIGWMRPKYRKATAAHRIVLISPRAWTLFLTGPVVRKWGFLCPHGWVPWQEFTDETGNQIGKGCG